MAQDENTGILGISLIDDQLRIVQGLHSGEEFQITKLAQGRMRHAFNFRVFADKNMPRRFAEDIMRLYASQGFEVKDVAFSLDSKMVFVKKLPIDKGLDVNRVEEQINWEVQQSSISPIDEYIIDFEELNSEQPGPFLNMLVVIVRKKIVRFLRQVFKDTELKLKVVDVDIFSAQRALQLNYECNGDKKVGLVDIGENKVHFSLLSGRQLQLCQDLELPINGAGRDNSARTQMITKELRRIITDQQIGQDIEDLNEIFLYGEGVEDNVLEELQNNYDVRIDRANPFRKVRLSGRARDEFNEDRAERFMISVGAALRGLQ